MELQDGCNAPSNRTMISNRRVIKAGIAFLLGPAIAAALWYVSMRAEKGMTSFERWELFPRYFLLGLFAGACAATVVILRRQRGN